MKLTPFGYIKGPFYTYELTQWTGPDRTILQPIYVGRGRGWRAKTYFRIRGRRGQDLYHAPKTHNVELSALMAAVRKRGFGVGIIAHDHGNDFAACKRHEKELIRRYGRVGVHRDGSLLNRNNGG